MNNKTINYYNKYTKSFIQTTRSVDFTNIQNKFLSYLPSGASIWACASILHLSKNDLFRVFHTMNQALKENGIIYTSFKYGEFEGERNGRYFTDFTEDSSKEFILQIPQLQIKEIWTTGDVREGRGDERWLNILICKGKIS